MDQFFFSTFLYAPIGMCVSNMYGQWVKVNPAFCKMFGYSEEEMLNMTYRDITYTEDLHALDGNLEKLIKGKIDSFHVERRFVHKTGRTIWGILNVSVVRDKVCLPSHQIFQIMDITERKQTEEKLKEIGELHQLISEHTEDSIVHITPAGYVQYVSPAIYTQLGYQPEEMIGKNIYDFWHPADLDNWLKHGDRENRKIVFRVRHKNGHYLWHETNSKKIRNEAGDVKHVIAISRDITDRKKMELRLQEIEQRHKSLVKYTPVGIFGMDLDGKFFEVSPSYEEMTGYSSSELLTMTFRDVVHPEMAAWGEANYGMALKGELPHVELALRHKNGSRIEVIASSSPIIINGEPVGIYVITRDITKQKQTEEHLLKAEKLSLVGELAAGIAHEIRNPLTSLRGFVQLFQLEDIAGARKLYHDVMLSEIDRINEIISEFLVLAKPANEAFDLLDIVKKLKHVITLFEGQAHLCNITIHKDFDEGLPSIRSQRSLKQVFINILKNAIESMSNGGSVLVQARKMADAVCVRFIDNGCGIEPDQLTKLGTPFYTTKETGTGLGLMVSQRIVQNHKGTMRIESEAGKGTTVEVLLPIG